MQYTTISGSKADVHSSVTEEVIAEAAKRYQSSLDNPGICLACGEEAMDCEPDARHYECEHCELPAVFGAEELVMMFII